MNLKQRNLGDNHSLNDEIIELSFLFNESKEQKPNIKISYDELYIDLLLHKLIPNKETEEKLDESSKNLTDDQDERISRANEEFCQRKTHENSVCQNDLIFSLRIYRLLNFWSYFVLGFTLFFSMLTIICNKKKDTAGFFLAILVITAIYGIFIFANKILKLFDNINFHTISCCKSCFCSLCSCTLVYFLKILAWTFFCVILMTSEVYNEKLKEYIIFAWKGE
ncbi:hypothetical protein EDEG_00851 [Edhazardia aedis USNM 41457]|uniref:Uncharacterized protein n=1 Tax=Edhazardia aedis (strain USNM 41457) TaxID=1003232 RepID=J9DR96_EDHAE|nr:hypothetical protein EDEG_00851 [Edhazardia aedis USNM 41457]|eukprot:EJW05070.1 hypothetical protein EDEG_00851 [Edhazardia aedis USNM 41457]